MSGNFGGNATYCNAPETKAITETFCRSMHHTQPSQFPQLSSSWHHHRSIIITDPKTKKQNDLPKEARRPLKMSGETKVADVASQLRQKLPVNRNSVMRLYEWYHRTYFRGNSFQPVVHVMIGAGVLGYLIEYPHIKHELEEEKKRAYDV